MKTLADILRTLGAQQVDPDIPTGAYPQINPFTGNPMAGGFYLDGGVCPVYEEYEQINKGGDNHDGSDHGV